MPRMLRAGLASGLVEGRGDERDTVPRYSISLLEDERIYEQLFDEMSAAGVSRMFWRGQTGAVRQFGNLRRKSELNRLKLVCGELLILGKSAIRHTHAYRRRGTIRRRRSRQLQRGPRLEGKGCRKNARRLQVKNV